MRYRFCFSPKIIEIAIFFYFKIDIDNTIKISIYRWWSIFWLISLQKSFFPFFSIFEAFQIRFSSPHTPSIKREILSYVKVHFCAFFCLFFFVWFLFFFLNIELSIFSHMLRYDIDIYKNIDIRYIAFDMPTTTWQYILTVVRLLLGQ